MAQANKYNSFYRLTQHENLENYKPLVKLIENFPEETTVIGIELDGNLYIIEGMHRCAAVALASWQLKKLKTNIKIAVGSRVGSKPTFLRARIKHPVIAEIITRLE